MQRLRGSAMALVLLFLVASCKKREWTAQEVVAELRALGLPAPGAHEVTANACGVQPNAGPPRSALRFTDEADGTGPGGCVIAFESSDVASRALAHVSEPVRATRRDNVIVTFEPGFPTARADAYERALRDMWGGE